MRMSGKSTKRQKPQTCSAADSHASLIQLLANAKVKTTNETSGQNVFDLFDCLDPVGASLKTSLACSLRCLGRYVMNFEERVTKSGHWFWVPMMSDLLTDGNESGSFATPNTLDYLPPKSAVALNHEMTVAKPGRSRPANLRDQLTQSWPTPDASVMQDGETLRHRKEWLGQADQANRNTNGNSQDWYTPTRADHTATYQSDKAIKEGWKPRLNEQVRGQRKMGVGKLNPAWVTQLMGFPDGWLDVDESN